MWRRRCTARPVGWRLTAEHRYDARVSSCAAWFCADPRRLCVLGVWLHLAGLATLIAAVVAGLSVLALLAGIGLLALSAWAKVAGVALFRAMRLTRRRPALASGDSPARSARAI